MKVKTLHLTNAWHAKSGGIRTFYLAMLDAANRRGQEMHVVVPAETDGLDSVGAYGTIHYVRAPFAPGSHCYRMIYPHEYLWPGGRVNKILRHVQPDLVEFCDKFTLNYLGGLLRIGMLPGVTFRPALVGLSCETFAGSVEHYTNAGRLGQWLSKIYLRWLYFPLADHHIAVSHYVSHELEAVSDGHKVDRCVWLGPMGVDYNAFSSTEPSLSARSQLLRRLGVSERAALLLFAGRLAKEKNIPLLFDTMRELDASGAGDYQLVVAGDGDERAALEERAVRVAPGKVHFLGHQTKPELLELFSACDVFVHPNPQEPFGIGPLEAMAAGLPLVAPASGGVLNYASHDNAWLADPAPQSFSEAIRNVVSDPVARAVKQAKARATAQACNWDSACRLYFALYNEIHRRVCRQGGAPEVDPLFRSSRERWPARHA